MSIFWILKSLIISIYIYNYTILITGDFMFNRYLIMRNKGVESLYLYIDDYYEFSSEFNSGAKLNKNMKDIVNTYIKENHIVFNGIKVFIVVSGIVISYIVLNNNLPIDKNWISDFEPTIKNLDKTETINDLIDKVVNIDI